MESSMMLWDYIQVTTWTFFAFFFGGGGYSRILNITFANTVAPIFVGLYLAALNAMAELDQDNKQQVEN